MLEPRSCSVSGCQAAYYARGFCNKHYQRVRKYDTPDDRLGDHIPLETRFWLNVVLGPECWEWSGPTYKGYGRIWWKGETLRAHRAAWLLARGEIPAGLQVCHRCDNPSCVRVEHLFIGTHDENVADRHAKGRDARPDRRGILAGKAKLTEEAVRAIRCSEQSNKEIAAEYALDPSTSSDIRRRKSWRHI